MQPYARGVEERSFTVTDEELRRLDASYETFPSFAEWSAKTHVDVREWTQFRDLLARRRAAVSSDAFAASQRYLTRAAAVDTGAIEGLYATDRGFTVSVAREAPYWEQGLAERGPLAPALFEAQLSTYELVLDAATRSLPVTEAWIRRLHEELCSPQETYVVRTPVGPQEHNLMTGQYKRFPNHVLQADGTRHAYAPVERVPEEMQRFVNELQSQEFERAHAVRQASYAHYCLVVIHPFADGNGRVARALASTYFYRDLSLPFVVLSDQKEEYWDSLASADAGEWQVFVSFVLDRGIEAVQLADDALAAPTLASAESAAAGLVDVLTTTRGLTHQQLDEAAARTLDDVQSAFRELVQELTLPTGVGVSWANVVGEPAPPPGYRVARIEASRFSVKIVSQPPAFALTERTFECFVATSSSDAFAFAVIERRLGARLTVRLSEVVPVLTPAFQFRVRRWADRILAEMLEDVKRQAAEALQAGGFSG